MKLCFVGDLHGCIYDMIKMLPIEREGIDAIISVGDFGIWPDPSKVDKKTREKGSIGDFPKIWEEQYLPCPVPIYFCKGNHEDFDFLANLWDPRYFNHDPKPNLIPVTRILPNLIYCPNGSLVILGRLKIGFMGGSYASSKFEKHPTKMYEKGRRHFHRIEYDYLIEHGPIDILVTHEPMDKDGNRYHTDLVAQTEAEIVFSGHHHRFRCESNLSIIYVQLGIVGSLNWYGIVDTSRQGTHRFPIFGS